MTDPQDLAARLTRLEHELSVVVRRLDAMQAAGPPHGAVAADPLPEPRPEPVVVPEAVASEVDLAEWATLLGRSFVVFGGAYLLRALTEGEYLPMMAGAGLGLLYAGGWLWAAHRHGATRRLSANVHGVTAVLVGWPLVWEASARFALLGPAAAALALMVLTTGAYVVAHRHRLPVIAGVAGFGTVIAALAVAMSADQYGAVSLLLVTLGSVTYWVSDAPARGWLRWPMAIAAGLSVMALTSRALATPPREPMLITLVAQMWVLATMQGSLAVRFVLLQRPARVFDMLQAASGLVIGIGGAVLVTRQAGAGVTLVGAVAALFAAGAYLAAYLRLVDRPRLLTSYYTALTFGVVSLVAALFILLEGAVLVMVALALAFAAFVAPAHVRLALVPHAAWLVIVALSASGAVSLAWTAWVGTPAVWPSIPVLAALTTGVGLLMVLRPQLTPDGGVVSEVARASLLVCAVLVVAVIGAVGVTFVAPVFAGNPPDAGVLASVRTGVVAVLALALGLAARWPRTAVLASLVYPVLVAGGLRLVLDDFRHSEPSTMFIALALYGAALAFAPRIASRKRAAPLA